MHPLLDSSLLGQVADQLLDPGFRERLVVARPDAAPAGDEDPLAAGVLLPHPVDVLAQPAAGGGGDRHMPGSSLAADPDVVLASALNHVADPEADQLPDPDPGVGEEADDQGVPLVVRGLLDALDLLAAEDVQLRPLGEPREVSGGLDLG